jgi:stage II sporulation protein D
MLRSLLACSLLLSVVTGPLQDEDAALVHASAGRTVRVRVGANGIARITDLPGEVYVARVLAAEGEPKAGGAAQRALAIAIRTFAAANAGRHARDGFDLCDTTHCQVLRPATPASRAAALATAGQLLVHDGRPAEVFYSASCGGRSEAAAQVWAGAINLPYLRSAEDDAHGGEEAWTVELSLESVEEALHRAGFEGRLRNVRVSRRSDSGRATRLEVEGLLPEEIRGEDFRLAIGPRELRSTRFTVTKAGALIRLTGYGYGHGVGLCVVGAGRRAARGETVSQILEQYYPGLRLEPAVSLPVTTPREPASVPAAGSATAAAIRIRDELAATLGVDSTAAVRVQIHETLEAFRLATGRPWWFEIAVNDASIDLAPMAVLAQHEGTEPAIRRGVAEMLLRDALADRPAWVRVGAARYYASSQRPARPTKNVRCPSDAELTMALSAPALREAERRAEACFARALSKVRDWRDVR